MIFGMIEKERFSQRLAPAGAAGEAENVRNHTSKARSRKDDKNRGVSVRILY